MKHRVWSACSHPDGRRRRLRFRPRRASSPAGDRLADVRTRHLGPGVGPGTTIGTTIKDDGTFTLAVPTRDVTLRSQYRVQAQGTSRSGQPEPVEVALERDYFQLEAIVVTGQATGVERKNLANAVATVTRGAGDQGADAERRAGAPGQAGRRQHHREHRRPGRRHASSGCGASPRSSALSRRCTSSTA